MMGAHLKIYVEVRVIKRGAFKVERRLDEREWPTW
jgi:hypothetical protein